MEQQFIQTEGNSDVSANPNTSPVLTIADVAVILRCSKAHVFNVLNGKVAGVSRLTHVALGRRKIVRRDWLEEWMEVNKCQ